MRKNVQSMRKTVQSVLRDPHEYEWTTQGFGMLRTYLDPAHKYRLNLWHASIRKPGVSMIHDHPWDFTSTIIEGSIVNERFIEVACDLSACHYSYATIKCGPGGGMVNCQGDIDLHSLPVELYAPGDTYTQKSNEIHQSRALDGTVTLIERTFHPDTEHARVFWRRGMKWVDAEPRVATREEIATVTQAALALWRE